MSVKMHQFCAPTPQCHKLPANPDDDCPLTRTMLMTKSSTPIDLQGDLRDQVAPGLGSLQVIIDAEPSSRDQQQWKI